MSRASTMLLALLILNCLLGLLCLAVVRGGRPSRALRLWGWGLLVYSAGLVITIADFLPYDLRKVIGNALIAYAPILAIGGAISDTGVRLDRRWTRAGFALSVAPIVVNHLRPLLPHPLVLIDILAPAPLANILFVFGGVVLLRRPPAAARGVAWLLAGSCWLSVLIWTLRMAMIWVSVGGSNDRERADLVVALFSIAQIVSAVAATLGLLWIEVRKMEAELLRQADTDALTGLANRRATMRRFAEEAGRAARQGGSLGLALFDLDRFKEVNDTHGHLAGDAVLRHVAAVLRASCREVDTVGRIGGEEFVALLAEPGAGAGEGELAGPEQRAEQPAEERAEQRVEQRAERLRAALAASPACFEGRTLAVTLSGGLALLPSDGADWDQLFLAADRRLYAAKRGGRDRVIGPAARGGAS